LSQRVHSNIGWGITRQLGQPFSGNAIGIANPNSLNSSKPKLADAMGRAGKSGVVSFAHDGASQAFTLFIWSDKLNGADPTNGWLNMGANSTEYTKTVDPHSVASFTIPEDAYFFIMAGVSACPNCWTGGAVHAEANQTNDQ